MTHHHHKYTIVGHDGRTVTVSDQEVWKLLSQKRFLIACCLGILLPVLFVRMFFSNVYIHEADEYPESQAVPQVSVATDFTKLIDFTVGGCNIWHGEWVPNPSGPAYTNTTCFFIQEHQNCIKNGRPDLGYLYWRWKPDQCELPLFNAKKYLKLVRDKSWAFIGDSIARNHFQSFLCSLAQVEVPENLYRDEMDRNLRWYFPSYNFTLSIVWAPYLVEGTEEEAEGYAAGIEKLYLDKVDPSWALSVNKYDYIVLSSGQWYLKNSVYLTGNQVIGGHNCGDEKVPQLGFFYAYRAALRTVFDFLISSDYKGNVFFRTFTPDHFENGRWDNGGNCTRTVPFTRNSSALEGMTAEMYKIQLEEFGKTVAKEYNFKLKIVDSIHASLLRPDAHPGPYRNFQPFAHDKNAKVQNDCLHWCLPGAVDTWSAMILEVLKHL